MIAHWCTRCVSLTKLVVIAVVTEFLTFPVVHTIWERVPVLHNAARVLGIEQ